MSDKEALEKLRDLRHQAKSRLEEAEIMLEKIKTKYSRELFIYETDVSNLKSEVAMWDKLIANLRES